MAVNDDITRSLSAHLVDLASLERRIATNAVRILREAEEEILARLAEIDPTSDRNSTYRTARLRALLAQVRGTLGTARGRLLEVVHEGLEEVAGDEFGFSERLLERNLAPLGDLVSVNTVAVSPELLRRVSRSSIINLGGVSGATVARDWIAQFTDDLQRDLSNQLYQGVIHGDGMAEIVRRIRGGGVHRGVMPLSRTWAESFVRTAVTTISTQARADLFRANRDTVKGVYQVSTLDERTTVICIVYAGKAWVWNRGHSLSPAGHSLPYNGGCPRHLRCRSTINPWVRSWGEMGLPRSISGNLKKRFNGKVPRAVRGQVMLDAADEGLQRTVLGATRFRLWSEGQITLEDMLDSRGRVRKVAGLRRLAA